MNRIREKISNLISNAEISEERLLQEVAIILEKKDINEELSIKWSFRTASRFHSRAMRILVKFVFLLQEINRKLIPLDQKLII